MKKILHFLLHILVVRFAVLPPTGHLSFGSEIRSPACPPNKKKVESSGTEAVSSCVDLVNDDVMRAMHILSNPPTTTCKNTTVVQGLAVCEDDLPEDCLIWRYFHLISRSLTHLPHLPHLSYLSHLMTISSYDLIS